MHPKEPLRTARNDTSSNGNSSEVFICTEGNDLVGILNSQDQFPKMKFHSLIN